MTQTMFKVRLVGTDMEDVASGEVPYAKICYADTVLRQGIFYHYQPELSNISVAVFQETPNIIAVIDEF